VNLHNPPARTIRAPRRQRLMDAQNDQEGAAAVTLSLLADRRRVTALALAAAGWAATLAAVIADRHLGRGAVVQIVFAVTMITFATAEALLYAAPPVIIEDRISPARAARSKRLGIVALVTGCMLGPAAVGAALGADWGTSLLTTLAVACAIASIAGRLARAARAATPRPACTGGGVGRAARGRQNDTRWTKRR
jgi:hypothetical protein